MDFMQCTINRIENLLKEKDLSANHLGDLSGVPVSTIQNILYKTIDNPGMITIKKICDGFGIDIVEFFDSKEFDSVRIKKER